MSANPVSYRFKLYPFAYDDLSPDELEMKAKACREDAAQEFESADVSLNYNTISISISNGDELTAKDCKERFKRILQQESICLGANALF
ncbi:MULTISPECIES: hypothetical protein [Pseudomonas]|uniref:hypothetical protein n=1 Tax=Pseudomonas TaxID=286 RepID=UPI0008636485|nr:MULTISPECIES: hypothetical protein [Pseudomonas]MBA6124180.1 hypothetical protein [Pseudomonas juntendi]MCF3159378.1 hypothetical protein [Pseudomonas juntendi]